MARHNADLIRRRARRQRVRDTLFVTAMGSFVVIMGLLLKAILPPV